MQSEFQRRSTIFNAKNRRFAIAGSEFESNHSEIDRARWNHRRYGPVRNSVGNSRHGSVGNSVGGSGSELKRGGACFIQSDGTQTCVAHARVDAFGARRTSEFHAKILQFAFFPTPAPRTIAFKIIKSHRTLGPILARIRFARIIADRPFKDHFSKFHLTECRNRFGNGGIRGEKQNVAVTDSTK